MAEQGSLSLDALFVMNRVVIVVNPSVKLIDPLNLDLKLKQNKVKPSFELLKGPSEHPLRAQSLRLGTADLHHSNNTEGLIEMYTLICTEAHPHTENMI